MKETLPARGRGGKPRAQNAANIPFAQLFEPAIRMSRRWPHGRLRVYIELVLRCANRPEHRVKTEDIVRDLDMHERTVNEALRALERLGLVSPKDPPQSNDGRRWRLCWVDYNPGPRAAAVDERPPPPPRRKGRGNPKPKRPPKAARMESSDPRIRCASDPGILSSSDPRIRPSLQDPYPDRSLESPSEDLTGSARVGCLADGRFLQKLADHASSRGLGHYGLEKVAEIMRRADDLLELELGRRAKAREWWAFAQETWHDPTIKLGDPTSPLAVAVCARRLLPWFRARWRLGDGERAKALSGAPRAAQRGASEATAPDSDHGSVVVTRGDVSGLLADVLEHDGGDRVRRRGRLPGVAAERRELERGAGLARERQRAELERWQALEHIRGQLERGELSDAERRELCRGLDELAGCEHGGELERGIAELRRDLARGLELDGRERRNGSAGGL